MKNLLAVLLAAAVAGCTSTLNVSPMPSPTSQVGPSVETQRVEAQAGIAVAQAIQLSSLFSAVLGALPLGGGTLPDGTCKNGVETTVTVKNPEELNVKIGVFYDKTCKHRFLLAFLTTTYFPGGTLEIVGTSTAYDTKGAPVAYASISSKGTAVPSSAHLVTTGTISKTPKGTALLSFGLTCTFGAANDCGFGGIVNLSVGGTALGVTSTLKGFVGSGAATGTASVNGYVGTPGSLTLKQGSGNSWLVGGGSLLVSPAGPFHETVDATSLNVTGSLALKDAINAVSVSLDFGTRTGIAHGNVSTISPVKTYSTFSTNASGTGSIKYSQGPAGQILFFIIQS